MMYEIEGHLEDPNTGNKLPIRATFGIKEINDLITESVINEVIELLDIRCEHYEKAQLYDKMDVVERILTDIKENFSSRIKDDTDDKCQNEHTDGADSPNKTL